MRLEHGRVFAHQLFAGARADVLLELGELVGPHQRHETHAAGGRRADAHADGIEQRPAQQQAGGGVAFHRVAQVRSELAIVALARGHHDAHAGFVVEFSRRQHQVELQLRAVAEQRGHFQRVIGPLSLAAGDQRALERGMRAVFEQVHERLADDRAGIRVAEQLEPGLVGIDHDAFLHLQDGVVGTLQHRLQLAPIVARRLQRGIQRALEPERAQFARNHRLHAIGGRQRNDVARADAHAASRCRLRKSAGAPAASAPAARADRARWLPAWRRSRRRRRRSAVRDSAARAPRRGRAPRESRCNARVHRPCASGC